MSFDELKTKPAVSGSNSGAEFVTAEIDAARTDLERATTFLTETMTERARLEKLNETIREHTERLRQSFRANDARAAHAKRILSLRKRSLFDLENGAIN